LTMALGAEKTGGENMLKRREKAKGGNFDMYWKRECVDSTHLHQGRT